MSNLQVTIWLIYFMVTQLKLRWHVQMPILLYNALPHIILSLFLAQNL